MCPSNRTYQGAATKATPDFWPAFEILDVDHDGKIGRDDLRAFYGISADDDVIGAMISAADTNRDGYVEYEEFEHVLGGGRGTRKVGNSDGVMEEVFRMMDRDGDGVLSSEDMRGYMEGAGLCASDEDVRAMMRLGGGSEKDGVTFDGFLKILGMCKHV